MTADRLREAARVLRERAEAATPGPWCDEYSGRTGPVVMDAASRNALDHVAKCSHFRDRSDAAYIATMHPVVGLALANWLDAQADTTCDCGVDEFALAVANLILGTARNVDFASPF